MIKNISVYIDDASEQWKDAFPNMNGAIEEAVTLAYTRADKPEIFQTRNLDINVVLSDDAHIQALNADYRDKDAPTNVLSFPQFDLQKFSAKSMDAFPPEIDVPLGDIVLAFETIVREAKEQNKPLKDHTVHLSVHGLLHLLGYDHINDPDAETMESLERDILLHLGYPDPYHTGEA